MKAGTWAVMAAGVAAMLVASGCTRVEPYKPMADKGQAADTAGLVVEGTVTNAEAVQHIAGQEIKSSTGIIGTDCVAVNKVTMDVSKTIKGSGAAQPMEFWYYGPCFHPAKGVKVTLKHQAILKGDNLRVYLQLKDGKWWLISDEFVTPKPSDGTLRERLYEGTY